MFAVLHLPGANQSAVGFVDENGRTELRVIASDTTDDDGSCDVARWSMPE